MKRISVSLFAAILSLGLLATDADAKRLGGGSSFGMQRAPITQRAAPSAPASVPSKAAPAVQPAPAAAPQPAPKRSWLGPLAGLAAGVGLGALLGSAFGGGGMGGGFGSIIMMLLMAGAVYFLIKAFFGRKSAAPLSYAGGQDPAAAWQPAPAAPAPVLDARSSGTPAIGSDLSPSNVVDVTPIETPAPSIPAGFDTTGFLRQAKVNFHRLQAANDTCNLADLKEFTTPEIFGELKMQIDERKGAHQQTEVLDLNADLMDVTTEAERHIASVRFHGQIREEKDQPAIAFNEVWHLTKPTNGSSGWLVAGIEQLQ